MIGWEMGAVAVRAIKNSRACFAEGREKRGFAGSKLLIEEPVNRLSLDRGAARKCDQTLQSITRSLLASRDVSVRHCRRHHAPNSELRRKQSSSGELGACSGPAHVCHEVVAATAGLRVLNQRELTVQRRGEVAGTTFVRRTRHPLQGGIHAPSCNRCARFGCPGIGRIDLDRFCAGLPLLSRRRKLRLAWPLLFLGLPTMPGGCVRYRFVLRNQSTLCVLYPATGPLAGAALTQGTLGAAVSTLASGHALFRRLHCFGARPQLSRLSAQRARHRALLAARPPGLSNRRPGRGSRRAAGPMPSRSGIGSAAPAREIVSS
jgi:hypothetical protein